jgi:hypothetical protein
VDAFAILPRGAGINGVRSKQFVPTFAAASGQPIAGLWDRTSGDLKDDEVGRYLETTWPGSELQMRALVGEGKPKRLFDYVSGLPSPTSMHPERAHGREGHRVQLRRHPSRQTWRKPAGPGFSATPTVPTCLPVRVTERLATKRSTCASVLGWRSCRWTLSAQSHAKPTRSSLAIDLATERSNP